MSSECGYFIDFEICSGSILTTLLSCTAASTTLARWDQDFNFLPIFLPLFFTAQSVQDAQDAEAAAVYGQQEIHQKIMQVRNQCDCKRFY